MKIRTDSIIIGIAWGIAGILFWKASSSFRQLFAEILGPEREHPVLTSAVLSVPSLAWLLIFTSVGLLVMLKDIRLSHKTPPLNWPFVIGLVVLSAILLVGLFHPLVIIHYRLGT